MNNYHKISPLPKPFTEPYEISSFLSGRYSTSSRI